MVALYRVFKLGVIGRCHNEAEILSIQPRARNRTYVCFKKNLGCHCELAIVFKYEKEIQNS